MEQERYNLEMYCTNCDFEGNVSFDKGTPYDQQPCPNCGVTKLEKKAKQAAILPEKIDYE